MQKKQKATSLVWFGNDLRITDNEVLNQALQQNNAVLGVYCINPNLLINNNFGFCKLGKFRAKFLLQSLCNLKQKLYKKNITLLVYLDSPQIIIPKLCDKFSVSKVYKQKEWTLEEEQETKVVQCKIPKIPIIEVYNQFLYHPDDITTNAQKIPNVFSNFRKNLEKYIVVRDVSTCKINFPRENIIDVKNSIPTLKDLGYDNFESDPRTAFPFEGGETEALNRLRNYFFETKRLGFYKKTRNGLVGKDFSSKFSPWLANGCISSRTIYWNVKAFEKQEYKNQSTYWMIFELIWRDYFKYISIKHGNNIFKRKGILRKNYQGNNNSETVLNWIDGKTKNNFVNANMIELKSTGWMSNRGRQNVASYFSKNLKLDWRIGAAYFEKQLLDYDVHSNYGNWMYVSGVGNDPRDRTFNTQLQAERYDENHKFRNLWLQTELFNPKA